ncbi:hypothetical protein EJ02DRAFT_39173 [Clathrospora elynae]|uniref:Uncharacterized protein n=1 Tax=Clathrospora elynae TaxID=706981 RepID=A0A6A5SEJ7_9PLEO|nr:hypothetical protein EJ02DRAFT_39173 [Clathrospora elynae]
MSGTATFGGIRAMGSYCCYVGAEVEEVMPGCSLPPSPRFGSARPCWLPYLQFMQ